MKPVGVVHERMMTALKICILTQMKVYSLVRNVCTKRIATTQLTGSSRIKLERYITVRFVMEKSSTIKKAMKPTAWLV